MKRNIILLILVLLGSNLVMHAQTKHNKQKDSNVTITGNLDDSLITKYAITAVELLISRFPAVSINAPYTIYEDTTFSHDKPFRFKVLVNTNRSYMTIGLVKNGAGLNWSSYDNVYILNKGDNIKCKLSNKFYQFIGRGAEKLNCQSDLYRFRYKPVDSESKLLNAKQYSEYYNRQDDRLDSLFRLQLEVVKRYAPKIGKEMTDIMTANCYGLRYYAQLNSLLISASIGYPEQLKEYLNSASYKKIEVNFSKKVDPKLLVASPIYTDFLYQKICVENIMNGKGNVEKYRSVAVVNRIYKAIVTSYNGILREKLLATFFFNYKYTDTSQYWPEILKMVKNNEYRNELLQQMKLKEMDVPFFPFELKDSLDQTITLTALKSKVVIFDFWYTGCENCVVLNKAMAPVVAKYKNNPKVLFVSVSIDKDRANWIQSVSKHLYTHTGSLDLYTNGLGYNHPLIKHYGINGYPTLFILKNGKMLAATPDRPQLDYTGRPTTTGATGRFVALIESALKTTNDNKKQIN